MLQLANAYARVRMMYVQYGVASKMGTMVDTAHCFASWSIFFQSFTVWNVNKIMIQVKY